MSVSVIIPFYNAQNYIQGAIDSALSQPEVTQIILVDDGSNDRSLEICQKLALQNIRIIILKHKNNQGRAAARNSGLAEVKEPYCSFLDADDFYLENRFKMALKYLNTNKQIDGVYEPVKSQYEVENGADIYPINTGLATEVHPNDLFKSLVLGTDHFSIIGCTFRCSSIKDNFFFDQTLNIGEDTDFIWRAARELSLVGIDSTPKAIRRVHGNNTLFNPEKLMNGKFRFYQKWLTSFDQYDLSGEEKRKIISSYAYYKSMKLRNNLLQNITHRIYQVIEYAKRPSLWLGILNN
jgi:glycosyltransferase involved in cell wall biosynthesis